MNKNITNLLYDLKFSNSEIKDLINQAPMLDIIDFSQFFENLKIVTTFGYPEEDLAYLISANPNIFIISPAALEQKLNNLAKDNKNIESTLKTNPHII